MTTTGMYYYYFIMHLITFKIYIDYFKAMEI
jgi:hypothetical protein